MKKYYFDLKKKMRAVYACGFNALFPSFWFSKIKRNSTVHVKRK